ncbi:unnamed protein product [[Candida] boidinii]|nr:unnamed protein product [[Candida] boidinii]
MRFSTLAAAAFSSIAFSNMVFSATVPPAASGAVSNVLAKRGHNLVCTDFPTDSLTEGFNVTRTTYKPQELQILEVGS